MTNKKLKLSDYCKNIRLKTKLTTQLFAKRQRCTRQYISKIENGYYDKDCTIANLKRLLRIYKLSLEDLLAVDIDPELIEGVRFSQNIKTYNCFNKDNMTIYYDALNKYLDKNGYKNIDINNTTYDLTAINSKNNKVICEMILSFSTGINLPKRKRLISERLDNFFKNVLLNECFSDNTPIELIVFTTSKKNYDALLELKKSHFENASTNFMSLKLLYINISLPYKNTIEEDYLLKNKKEH